MIIQLIIDGVIYHIPAEAQAEIALMFQITDAGKIAETLTALGCVRLGTVQARDSV